MPRGWRGRGFGWPGYGFGRGFCRFYFFNPLMAQFYYPYYPYPPMYYLNPYFARPIFSYSYGYPYWPYSATVPYGRYSPYIPSYY